MRHSTGSRGVLVRGDAVAVGRLLLAVAGEAGNDLALHVGLVVGVDLQRPLYRGPIVREVRVQTVLKRREQMLD